MCCLRVNLSEVSASYSFESRACRHVGMMDSYLLVSMEGIDLGLELFLAKLWCCVVKVAFQHF